MTKPNLKMVGEDGNAFAILGRARRAAKKANWSDDSWHQVQAEATSGDYNNLLATMMKYFACDEPEEDEFDPATHATPEEIAANEAGESDEDAS